MQAYRICYDFITDIEKIMLLKNPKVSIMNSFISFFIWFKNF